MRQPASLARFAADERLPLDEEGPVFTEPWQAEAFALAVRLHEAGCFHLAGMGRGACCGAAGGPGPGRGRRRFPLLPPLAGWVGASRYRETNAERVRSRQAQGGLDAGVLRPHMASLSNYRPGRERRARFERFVALGQPVWTSRCCIQPDDVQLAATVREVAEQRHQFLVEPPPTCSSAPSTSLYASRSTRSRIASRTMAASTSGGSASACTVLVPLNARR